MHKKSQQFQWFTVLEMEPASVVIGGIIAIGIGIGIKRLDSIMKAKKKNE